MQMWIEYQGDMDVADVTHKHLRDYLTYMRTEYVPRRITGNNEQKLAHKTIRNIWITFKAFFRWTADEFDIPNPMDKVSAPKIVETPVEPFTKEQVEKLLKACDYTEEAQTNWRRRFQMRRATAKRDRALILVLLDTGLRASELSSLNIDDVEMRTGKIHVKHGVQDGAKGGKGRYVYLGKVARRTLWRYLADREDGEDPDAPLFLTQQDRPMNKNALRLLISQLGKKAGIRKCYPHKFRHTFAITYLRSDGDVFPLQMLLGHSSLDMVKRYARVAEIDAQHMHKKASPADNWRR